MAKVIVGDCLKVLGALPEHSVDLVFSSPPYEDCRTYNIEFNLKGQAWVDWMVRVYIESLRVCKGLVAFVVEGRTRGYSYSGTPLLLAADLIRAGITLRKPPVFHRVGIPGSGGPDWLRNDYEFIICATNGGRLPWSDNTAMGWEPKYGAGGPPTNRRADGRRLGNVDTHRHGDVRDNRVFVVPNKANPGNIIKCIVGGGVMGSKLAHENEAPFPESLAEFFVRSFCPPGGTVLDPFGGSGTTAAVAVKTGRNFITCDIRESQAELINRRLEECVPPVPIVQ
jgi:hypothetical protein